MKTCIVCLTVMLSGCLGVDGPDASRDQEAKGITEIMIGAIHRALVSKLKNSLDEDPTSAVDTPLDVSEINGLTPKEILIKYWPLTYETREEIDEKSTVKKLEISIPTLGVN